MSQKAIENDKFFGNKIKERRQSLNLTIEAAAKLAGVGTKTWFRYESGAPIRADKYRGVCKALNWSPVDFSNMEELKDINEYRKDPLWSSYLEKQFGPEAAFSFDVGIDLVSDHINNDLGELAKMPKGTHIGQIEVSELKDLLPPQFLMLYDYDFVYYLRSRIISLRNTVRSNSKIIAHSVIDEILMLIISQSAEFYAEIMEIPLPDRWGDWVFDLFGDMDVVTWLYSDLFYVSDDDEYHFKHWREELFYVE